MRQGHDVRLRRLEVHSEARAGVVYAVGAFPKGADADDGCMPVLSEHEWTSRYCKEGL